MSQPQQPGSRLAGKIALVTGAASGIGFGIAARFAAEGAQVVLTDRDGEAAKARAAELGALPLALDVTRPEDWASALKAVEDRLGGLHVLVHNAGLCLTGDVESLSIEDWRLTHAVNLDGVFLGCKHAIALIARTAGRDSGGARGSILNISSVSGMIAGAGLSAYNSSKAAVRHLSKSVALHCASNRDAITCNSIHPSFMDTPILDNFQSAGLTKEDVKAKLGRQVPMGVIGEPDDVAWGAVYLGSDEARFVTGAELFIDGGISAM